MKAASQWWCLVVTEISERNHQVTSLSHPSPRWRLTLAQRDQYAERHQPDPGAAASWRVSHQSESSSHSHSPSPVCTPLPFSESSRTYRGSVPNIVGATRSSPFQPSSASRPNHQHGNPTVSHSQPSLNSSRSRSSSRSPLGGASSSTSDHSAHAPIPRISPPPQRESRRRGHSRSGSNSPHQLQLPLKTLGGRPTDRSGSGGYANTMFCPPADGAPPPPYDDCFDSEEQDRITQDLAEVRLA